MQRPPTIVLQRAQERAFFDYGWLQTYHSFSFADYYDPENVAWGALRVFNDDTIAPSAGFPMHPHREMEILTYVLSGTLEHRDSMGHRGIVRAGGVQFMSAGTGVRHSEYNASTSEPLRLVQMWVLPGRSGAAPSYGQRDFAEDDRRNRWLVLASGRTGTNAPIALTQDATFAVARLEGTRVAYSFEPRRYGFLFVASGEVAAASHRLGGGDALRLYDVRDVEVEGEGEIVLWDLPPMPDAVRSA